MLQIKPTRIYDDPIEIQETLPASVLELDEPSARAQGPVTLNLVAQRDGESLIITGDIKTTLSMQCGRCAEWIDWPVSLNNFVQLLEAPLPDSIDLTPLIREDILLDLPVVAACRLTPERVCPKSGKTYPEASETPLPIRGEDVWSELDKIKEDKD